MSEMLTQKLIRNNSEMQKTQTKQENKNKDRRRTRRFVK